MSDKLTTYLELALSGEMKNGASLARARREDDNTDTEADNNADTSAADNTDTSASGNTDTETDNNVDTSAGETGNTNTDKENSAVVAGATACLLTTLFSL